MSWQPGYGGQPGPSGQYGPSGQPKNGFPGQPGSYGPAGQPGFAAPGAQPGGPYPAQPSQPWGQTASPYPSGPQYAAAGPQPGRKRMRAPLIVAIVIGGLLIAIVATVLGIRFITASRIRGMEFHPQGPASFWLDERYVDGYHTWSFTGMVLGVSPDRNVVAVDRQVEIDGMTTYQLAGLDVMTGEPVWESEVDLLCEHTSYHDGGLYCIDQTDYQNAKLVQVDLATGAQTVFYEAPFPISSARIVGLVNGEIVMAVSEEAGTRLLSFPGDSDITWQTVVEMRGDCVLLGGTHVGCASNEEFTVVDAVTGAITLPITELDTAGYAELMWATDGYVITDARVTMNDEQNQAYDFSGQPLEVIENARTPLIPNDYDGFYYPLADMSLKNYIYVVDAQGKAVMEGGGKFWPAGVQVGERYTLSPEAVSASGQVVLVNGDEGYQLYTRDGELVAGFDGLETFDLQVEEGLIIGDILAEPQLVYAPGPG